MLKKFKQSRTFQASWRTGTKLRFQIPCASTPRGQRLAKLESRGTPSFARRFLDPRTVARSRIKSDIWSSRVHERKRNETTTTTTTGADGKARRGTRYEHASSVLSALALLSELSRREREHRWSFEGFRATPTPYPSSRPLSLGNPRAPALAVFPWAAVPTQATRMSPTIESIATPAAGRLRARAFTRAVESSRIQARASPPTPDLHRSTCGQENTPRYGRRCCFTRPSSFFPSFPPTTTITIPYASRKLFEGKTSDPLEICPANVRIVFFSLLAEHHSYQPWKHRRDCVSVSHALSVGMAPNV